METFIPLISGARTGPLGMAHLPRFWLKMRAHAVGLLAEGYRHGNGGTDEDLLTTFGIDLDAFTAFIATAPDYLATETWVKANAKDTSPKTIRTFTEHWLTFDMPDPRRSEWNERFGLPLGAVTKAIEFNQQDDWDLIHEQLRAGEAKTPIVPAISSALAGPLGALHLPRLWIKARAHAAGRLAEGYRIGAKGFDGKVAEILGFDYDALAAYIAAEAPSYLATETWVRKNAKSATPEAIAKLNAHVRATNLPEQYAPAMRARLGLPDSFVLSIDINDLDDWYELHEALKAVAPV